MTALLAAAFDLAPQLVWPADVSPRSDLGQGFVLHLERLSRRYDARNSPRRSAATEIVRVALSGARPRAAGNAV